MEDHTIPQEQVREWGIAVFEKAGIPAADARCIVEALVQTTLWGIDSHGIARIPHYLTRFENGTLNKTPGLLFTASAAATGSMDGADGHGIVIMTKATEEAIALARSAGVGAVGVYNSSHCGAIGLYTRQITKAGMVGFAFTHADALVIPHGGRQPFLGTNPISIAFPTENEAEPVCMDMATSIVPWNYVMNARRENTPVPLGFGVDENGEDATDPHQIRAVKPMADHKGYALAFMIDMLCSVLNGVNFGPNMTSMYQDMDKKRKLGSFVIALDPMRFGGRDNFRSMATQMIRQVQSYGPDILFPGQPEYLSQSRRLADGIPVSDALMKEFNQWSDHYHIPHLQ